MRKRILFASLAASLFGTVAMPLAVHAAVPTVIYDAVPATLPPNVASLGYEATSTAEFGDFVHLDGTSRDLKSVTVTMSDWALHSDYLSDNRYPINSGTWDHPITVNIYGSELGSNGTPSNLLATKTQTVSIPWRPAADPTCNTQTAWRSPVDGKCYNGIAFNAVFDMSNLNVTLPNDVIIGVAYNTADYGTAPIHQSGPYNSLNVGTPEGNNATIGEDDNADNVFWNTSFADFYSDNGASGVGTFRQDTEWSPNGTVALKIDSSLTPTTKDDCKNDKWMSFNAPTFKNQGDCVSYTVKVKKSTTTLNSNNKNGINIPTKAGNRYMITVSGTWTNRPGEVVDAECTSWQNGPWLNAVNGGFSSDLLDVQVNQQFVNWGSCNATTHTYSHWVDGTGAPINLRVFDGNTSTNEQIDGWFGDNVGILNVSVAEHPAH